MKLRLLVGMTVLLVGCGPQSVVDVDASLSQADFPNLAHMGDIVIAFTGSNGETASVRTGPQCYPPSDIVSTSNSYSFSACVRTAHVAARLFSVPQCGAPSNPASPPDDGEIEIGTADANVQLICDEPPFTDHETKTALTIRPER